MPTILITGLTGFIALHIAHRFLQAGYTVRGTVRSAEKGDHVLSLPALKPYADKGQLSYVVVEDVITGDHTEAVKGVDIICHAASPVILSNEQSWEEMRDPAVDGTRTVLRAAAKEPSVKHVAQISSFAATSDWLVPIDNQVYNEDTWNPITDEQAANLHKTLPKEALPFLGGIRYCASKKFSELAAVEEHERSGGRYKLTRLCPPSVLGPTLDTTTSLAKQPLSMQVLMRVLKGKDGPIPPDTMFNYVDVRDFAESVLRVAGGGIEGRFAICGGQYDNQLVADHVRDLFQELDSRVPLGTPGDYPSVKGPKNTLDGSKAVRKLGLNYRALNETLRDAVNSILAIEEGSS